MKRQAKKTATAVLGSVVLATGIVMIPYPGPGWLVVFAGLGILATEFEWAKRILDFAKDKYDTWQDWLMRQRGAIKAVFWLLTAAVVVATIWLLNGYGILNHLLGIGWDWVESPLPIFHQ